MGGNSNRARRKPVTSLPTSRTTRKVAHGQAQRSAARRCRPSPDNKRRRRPGPGVAPEAIHEVGVGNSRRDRSHGLHRPGSRGAVQDVAAILLPALLHQGRVAARTGRQDHVRVDAQVARGHQRPTCRRRPADTHRPHLHARGNDHAGQGQPGSDVLQRPPGRSTAQRVRPRALAGARADQGHHPAEASTRAPSGRASTSKRRQP